MSKYLTLSLAVFLALGFIGGVNADITQETQLLNAVTKSVKDVQTIMESSIPVDQKTNKLRSLQRQIGLVSVVDRRSEGVKDELAKQFQMSVIEAVIPLLNDQDCSQKCAEDNAKKITVPKLGDLVQKFKKTQSGGLNLGGYVKQGEASQEEKIIIEQIFNEVMAQMH